MKKKSQILLLVFCLIPIILFSQKREIGGHFGIGAKRTVSIFDLNKHDQVIVSGILGMSIELPFSKRFSLITGIDLTRVKQSRETKSVVPQIEKSFVESYSIIRNDVLIPIVFRRYFGDKRRFFVGMGAYFGALLNGQSNFTHSLTGVNESTNLDDELRNMSLGGKIGIGYKFKVNDKIKCTAKLENRFHVVESWKSVARLNPEMNYSATTFGVGISKSIY